MSFLNRSKRLIFDTAIPRTRLGDKIAAYVNFVRSHRRLPRKHGLFSDNLFEIMTTDEVLLAERAFTSDKEFVKLFVGAVVGQHYNVPTLAVLKDGREIDAYEFDRPCVIKPTHASGLVRFANGPGEVDRSELKRWLEIDYYAINREANYRYLKPKIIVEPHVFGKSDVEDLKFFCVDGAVKLVQCDFDRHSNHTRRLYDRNWNDTGLTLGKPLSEKQMARPENLEAMIDVAEALSSYFSFVRIDMYEDDASSQFLVGEITHCHGRATETFENRVAEERITDLVFGPQGTDLDRRSSARQASRNLQRVSC